MRIARFAGQFYPSDRQELEKHIKKLIESSGKPEKCIGVIAPHAGYNYSGNAAAFSYNAISKKDFDTFVIIGVNHSARTNIAVSNEGFSTPLGNAETDKEFCSELIKEYGANNFAHLYEHSIEVQIPFLVYLFKNPKIVPILISTEDYNECIKLAEKINNISENLKRKICIIASSDFMHYGQSYGFVPFSGTKAEVKKKMQNYDRKAINFIKNLKSRDFFDFAKSSTICGCAGIAVAIELCKMLGCKKAKLLDYYTSGDISGDYENSVGYASVAFMK